MSARDERSSTNIESGGAADPGARGGRGLTRRRLLQLGLGAGVTTTVGLPLYSFGVEPHWLRVVDRPMPLTGLPPAWHGRRLIHISDLHVGPFVDYNYLRTAVRRTARMEPDLLCITGDLMTCDGTRQIDPTLALLRELGPVAERTLFVPGNHDYGSTWRDELIAGRLCGGLEELGIRVLRNEAIDLDGLQIVGLDDLWADRCAIGPTLGRLDADRPTVALVHNPDACDRPGWAGFRGWVLSGHTHGGQVDPPFLPPPLLPVQNRRYTRGRFDLGDGRTLHINPGLGYLRRVRLLVRPEITRFTLRPA